MKVYFEKIKSFTVSPTFEGDENKTRNAKLLYIICWATIVPLTIYIPIHLLTSPQTASRLFLAVIIYGAIGAAILLTRRGQVRLASMLFISFAWAFLSISSFTAGGTSAPAAGGYSLIVICAALLLGRKEAMLSASLGVLFQFFMALTSQTEAGENSQWIQFISNASFLAIITVMLVMARDSIEDTLRRLYEEICEREKVTSALQKSEARYRMISEISSDYTYEFGFAHEGKFNIEWVTDSFSRITGYSSYEEMERLGGLSVLVHPEDQPITQKRIARLIKGESDDSEFRIITKDGEVLWLHDFGKGIVDHQNRFTRIYGAAHEITSRKQAEFQLQGALEDLQDAYDKTIEGWVKALDLRDRETEGHTRRVTGLTLELASAMGFEADLPIIRRGALLHDIGKIAIPDKILRKPGALTRRERMIVEMHPIHAYEMLNPIEYLRPSIVIPFFHHERWDGSGYPQGLCGENIPIFARLFAVADVWDAMSSGRPYRRALPVDEVREYIESQAGRLFDPDITDLFLALQRAKEASPVLRYDSPVSA